MISELGYSVLCKMAKSGKSLYDVYKKPSLRKRSIWEYWKSQFEHCSIYSRNTHFITIIGIEEDGTIKIVYPTRIVVIKKG